MPSVLSDYRFHDSETARLLRHCETLESLPPVHQKFVAEMILLRLFDLFQNMVSSVTAKLVAGATYADGTAPNILARARSLQSARLLFQTHGRGPHIRYNLRWSTAPEIMENIKHVIGQHDNVVEVVDRNSAFIEELRRVRNRIAHNNAQSRRRYREVVRRHFGAYMNQVTPGMLLLTPRIRPSLIEQYIRQERIMAKDVVRG